MAEPAEGDPPGAAHASRRRRSSRRQPIGWSEIALAAGAPLIVYAAHLAFSAARVEVALGFVTIYGLLAAGLMGLDWGRAGLGRIRDARIPLILFGLTVAALIWGLTPFIPDGPHPLWSYVNTAGAAAVDRSAAALELVRLSGLVALFISAAVIGTSLRRADLFLKACVALGAAYAAWAIVAHLADPTHILGVAKQVHQHRLTGAFSSANTAGTLMAMNLVISAALLLGALRDTGGSRGMERVGRAVVLPGAAAALTGAGLLLSGSRAALAGAAIAVIVLLGVEAFHRRRRWRTAAILLGAAFISLAVLTSHNAGQQVAERTTDVGVDIVDRREIYLAHWNAFEASPWLGFGLGGFDQVNQLIITPANYDTLYNIRGLHNVYLQWLEEAGLIGAVLMFATLGAILFAISRAALARDEGDALLKAVLAASIVVLVHGLTDFSLQVPSLQAYWAALLGVAYGQARART